MIKKIMIGLISLSILVVSIFFVSATIFDKDNVGNGNEQITDNLQCSCGCNQDCNGNCKIEGCTCQKTCQETCDKNCGNTCEMKTCGCSK